MPVEIVGWTYYPGHAHHAIIIHPKTGYKHSACGRWPMSHSLRPTARYTGRCCRACQRVIYLLMTPKPAKIHRTPMPRGVSPEVLMSYVGWSRGLYDELAHHLIIIDRYHVLRAACRATFRRKKNGQPDIIEDWHSRTYNCQLCLRSRAYRQHGGAPEVEDA